MREGDAGAKAPAPLRRTQQVARAERASPVGGSGGGLVGDEAFDEAELEPVLLSKNRICRP
jgi:hypothetical protein